MNNNVIDQSPPIPVIGENNQQGIPQQQADPAIPPNDHYLPNGDLTIYSNYDYATSNVDIKKVPLTSIPSLFETRTDDREVNLVRSDNLTFFPTIYTPHNTIFLPNISQYIGSVVGGEELDQKYLEAVMLCCQAYLDGKMEILPSGFFRYLNAVRDGINRRYSQLCMAIYFSISEELYKPLPAKVMADLEIQSLIQDLVQQQATSMYVKLNKYSIDGQQYTITKAAVSKWLNTTPWHSIIYNSQAPMTLANFLRLFLRVFCLYAGKKIRYDDSMPNEINIESILPNSVYYTNLNPPNTQSFEISLNTNIPLRFVRLARYLVKTINDELDWNTDSESDDDVDDEENENDNQNVDNEADDSVLA